MNKQHIMSWVILVTIAAISGIGLGLAIKRLNIGGDFSVPIIPKKEPKLPGAPELTVTAIVTGLDHPWDVRFLPDETMIVPERNMGISVYKDGAGRLIHKPGDLRAVGEGGMLGLEVDPKFAANRYIYACFNISSSEVRLARFKVNNDLTALTDRTDIITGLPANSSGRHSGCRPRFGHDGYLWVGTGDAAQGTRAQDPKTLGGKVLRIDRDGKGAPDNLGSPFDDRIFSYGHRNVQGICFNPEGNKIVGYSVEHGPDRDDEINELVKGNFGWNPVPGYNESVPMTDKNKYPDAIDAVWVSGKPTTAPSGCVILEGNRWRDWDGALAFANLKGSHLRVLLFDDGKVKEEVKLMDSYGRLRSAVLGPDGNLYVTTDNGSNKDTILKVVAS